MKELLEILDVARRVRAEGRTFAVATVVKIGGSTYRRPGARMLIDGDGRRWGTISGGCLEGEVARQAEVVLRDGAPRLLPFELGEDDLVLGFGTGCDGVVHVLIEAVVPGSTHTVTDLLDTCIQARRRGVLATVIEGSGSFSNDIGSHVLLDESGAVIGGIANGVLQDEVLSGAESLLDAERRHGQTYLWHTRTIERERGSAEILLEVVRPPLRLFILGEGHDVRAIVRITKSMGWQVIVVGRKSADVLAERFPEADEHVFLMHPGDVLRHIAPDACSAAVVMNHTYMRDKELMATLLGSSIPYVGVLGPKERTARMIEELAADDAALTDAQLERLFGPVGLDIGTETPEEIALAAAAEIQAVLHYREGGSLRGRTEPIHAERA